MTKIKISDKEYLQLKDIIYKNSGIMINRDDIVHLQNKLYDRLIINNVSSFRDYYNLMNNDSKEIQSMINAITTNETYFFREKKQFDFLKDEILSHVKYDTFRCWSAAGSNGAEAYSIAMHVDYNLNSYQNWEVVTSDINDEVLEISKNAIYPIKYTNKIPQEYLEKYCKKGQYEDEGFFKISDKLTKNMKYKHLNLVKTITINLPTFDVIFLRNMIIYFDDKEKKTIVENVIKYLKPGGYLFMGHSESLHRITDKVKQIRPSIYKKV